MTALECVFCDQRRPFEIYDPFCPVCGAPMLVASSRTKKRVRSAASTAAERFADFLPLKKYDPALSLGVGGTPLLRLGNVIEKFDLPEVYAKNETANPTASFKDRGTVVAIQKVIELGIKKIGTISTGNMAGSTAASSNFRSRSRLRGYLSRSSFGPNCVGLTNMLTATESHSALARRASEICPSWR